MGDQELFQAEVLKGGTVVMEFKKYPSIENSYREKFINGFLTLHPELLTVEYIITEKIHGANFQICFESNQPWRYGKRTAFLKEDEKFYDAWNVVGQYESIFRNIQGWIDVGKIQSPARLFGELCGPGIQKGVSYGKEKQVRFFDMMIGDQLLAPFDFRIVAIAGGFRSFLVPEVTRVQGLQAALDYDVELDSLLSPTGGNICEGVVIAPLAKAYYDTRGRRFCLKKKNERFTEKIKAAKPVRPADPVITRLNLGFRAYITDNRLQSVFSQHGEIEEPSQIGPYIKFVLSDAKEAFLKDFGDEVAALPKSDQRKVFNVGSMIALMLKKYL